MSNNGITSNNNSAKDNSSQSSDFEMTDRKLTTKDKEQLKQMQPILQASLSYANAESSVAQAKSMSPRQSFVEKFAPKSFQHQQLQNALGKYKSQKPNNNR